MAVSMLGRSLLSIHDFSVEEIAEILRLTGELKEKRNKGEATPLLAGKTLGMVFQKRSTRTRVSFEVGMYELGGSALFLSADDLQLGRGETIADTAGVLSRYLHGIMARTYSHQHVVDLAEHGTVPVINGLTDLLHPCQALTDVFSILEKKGTLKGLKMTYVGDGNNMAHSLMYAGAKTGLDVTISTPDGYRPDARVVEQARSDAGETGAEISLVSDPREAVTGADVIYTDVWASMGQEEEHAKRVKDFQKWQVNEELISHAKDDCLVMHCLPAHRGEEITDGAVDGPHSIVFDQAENRLHTQKAIMSLLMG